MSWIILQKPCYSSSRKHTALHFFLNTWCIHVLHLITYFQFRRSLYYSRLRHLSKKRNILFNLYQMLPLSRNFENNFIFFWCSFVFSCGQRYACNLKRVKETLDEKALVIMKTTLAKRDRRHFTVDAIKDTGKLDGGDIWNGGDSKKKLIEEISAQVSNLIHSS